MAQSGYTPLIVYSSGTATNVPLAGNLAYGELALNYADGKIFYKNSSGVVTQFVTGVTSFQTSLSGLTPSTSSTGAITLAGTLGATSGGTGLATYATGDLIYASATNTLSKLAIGTNGYVLTIAAGVPTWTAGSSAGVSSFQTSLSGLTPSTATTGAVTLAGTLGATSGGTGFSTYATGDLVYASATNTLSKLTAGTNGYVLTLAAGVPTWAASTGGVTSFNAGTTGFTPNTASTGAITLAGTLAATNGGTGQSLYTVGDILYASTTTALSKLTAGTASYVLTSGGAGTAPSWAAHVTSFQTSLSGLTPATSLTGAITLAGTLGATSGGTAQTTYATGDILYASASNTLSKLTVGTSGQYLTVSVGGVPSWTTAVASGVSSFSAGTTGFTPSTATTGAVVLAGTLITSNGGTGLAAYTAGDTLYYAAGTLLSKLAIGTAYQIKAVNAGATAPSWQGLSSLIDNALTASTQGSVLYRNATGWVALGPGTNGYVLTSGGAAANPAWAASGAGGGVSTISFGSTGLTPSTASSGIVTVAGTLISTSGGTGLAAYTAGDLLYFSTGTALSKLGIGGSTTILTSSGTAPQWSAASGVTVGIATNIAGGAAGTTFYNTASATTTALSLGTAYQIKAVNAGATAPSWQGLSSLIDNALTASTQGTVLYRGASTWSALAPGTSGQFLTSGGAAANPSWSSAGSSVSTISFGTTGLTPSTATSGAVTVAGTLGPANGGTGIANNAAMTVTGVGNFAYTRRLSAATDVTFPTSGTLLSTAAVVTPAQGGTGIANNAASTITISGAFATTLTVSAATSITLPTSGTLATLGGSETLSAKILTNPTVTNYVESVVAIGNSSTAQTILLTNGTVQTVTLTGNCTFTMPALVAGKSFILLLSTGTGSFTSTFTSVKWPAATAPTITTTASRWDILSFVSDGTSWYGNYAQAYA